MTRTTTLPAQTLYFGEPARQRWLCWTPPGTCVAQARVGDKSAKIPPASPGGALPSTAASCRDPAYRTDKTDKTPRRGDRLYQSEGSQSAKTRCLPVSLPANWRELLEGLGYRVKGRRATCPLCGKDGLAVSVLRKGVYCHRSRAHFRSWAELAEAAPGQPRAAGARSSRVPACIQPGDREQIQRILARAAAAYEWVTARAAPAEHPYLERKRIPPFGARVDARGNLLVPVYGLSRMGMELLISLERITPEGQKRFEPGCRVKAGYCRAGGAARPDTRATSCSGMGMRGIRNGRHGSHGNGRGCLLRVLCGQSGGGTGGADSRDAGH
jgi:hypothetical protein